LVVDTLFLPVVADVVAFFGAVLVALGLEAATLTFSVAFFAAEALEIFLVTGFLATTAPGFFTTFAVVVAFLAGALVVVPLAGARGLRAVVVVFEVLVVVVVFLAVVVPLAGAKGFLAVVEVGFLVTFLVVVVGVDLVPGTSFSWVVFFASLTLPEGPLGSENLPASSPVLMAREMWELAEASMTMP